MMHDNPVVEAEVVQPGGVGAPQLGSATADERRRILDAWRDSLLALANQMADLSQMTDPAARLSWHLRRFLNIDSESALKRANRKFKTRFQHMEAMLASAGKSIDGTSLEEMEDLWRQAKIETAEQ